MRADRTPGLLTGPAKAALIGCLFLKSGSSAIHSDRPDSSPSIQSARRSGWSPRFIFFLVALLGLALRLPHLGARPMHTDEAVNAYIVGELLAGEAFAYDPHDRHGPGLDALALPLVKIQGARTFSDLTESELRATPVLAGTVTLLLFGAAVEIFGFLPSLIAALLFAGASLPVYYDRYFIHESLFVAATFGLILSGWRACKTNSVLQAAIAGACAAAMLACKETALLHFLALAGAALAFRLWNRRSIGLRSRFQFKPASAAALTFLLVSIFLFTWFGRHWSALPALLQAVPDFFVRAGGQGHAKPFWYYAQLLAGGWSGGLLLALAVLGFFLILRKRTPSPFVFLAWYAFLLAAIYSLIPYKTPWLALNLFLPVALLAGYAIASLWNIAAEHLPARASIPSCVIPGLALAALIAHDTRQRVFLHPSEETNPYAYAHTSEDVLGLPAEISDFAQRNGLMNPRIAVIASDPWPLSWYLRHFSRVGFWQPGQPVPPADFYITSTDAADRYASQLQSFRPDFFGVRPGVLILLWLPASR